MGGRERQGGEEERRSKVLTHPIDPNDVPPALENPLYAPCQAAQQPYPGSHAPPAPPSPPTPLEKSGWLCHRGTLISLSFILETDKMDDKN